MDAKIAVVILNWNGKSLLQNFLPKVVAHSKEATLYIADNASTDDSISWVLSQYSDIKIIQNNANFGFAKGYNEALLHVEEPYYALLNSDIEVTENWLQPIIEQFEKEPETAIIQPKILAFKRKTHFEYAGAAGGFIDALGYPYCRGRIFHTTEKDLHQYDDSSTIFWASGACFFIRKDVYRLLKGFDTDFFAHQEEIDLCWRAFNKNYEIKYNYKSIVYHVGGATLNEENPKKTYLNFRNSLFMLVKNLPKKHVFTILFLRLCLDGIAGIKFMTQGQWQHTKAIVLAHFSFYNKLIYFIKKRSQNQRNDYFHRKSIVWSYFLQKKKFFSDL